MIVPLLRRANALRILAALQLVAVSLLGIRSARGETVAAPILRALILSDGKDRGDADTTPFIRQLLYSSGRFDVRVCETPAGLTATTFAPFDVIVDNSTETQDEETQRAIESVIESGKGYVTWQKRLTASAQSVAPQFHRSTLTKLNWTPGPATPVAARSLFMIKIADPTHPIMEGLKPGSKVADEFQEKYALAPEATLLAATEAGEPLLCVSNHGKGRVVAMTFGSDLGAVQEDTFASLLLRGAEWAASGKVSLRPDAAYPPASPPLVRILVITGGHEHEAAFYHLFDDRELFGWAPVSDSTTAFQQDLRDKYDVLVMYDFTRDLDDKRKQNLRTFVESGKGVVVLHHGILNYQKWPWWYEQVAGGRYRLDREGGIPNSTVKFGEEHWITSAEPHPITEGLTPFHVTDETYHGLYISPDIRPLLLTDNPTSDRTVAWIGPCKTSKVVFIQLGHDHTPFRHPSYRGLVRNSILWSAGKLKPSTQP